MILIEVFLTLLGAAILFAFGWLALDYRDLRNKVNGALAEITQEFVDVHQEIEKIKERAGL